MNSSFPVDQTLFGRRSNPARLRFFHIVSQTTRDRLGQPLPVVEALGAPAQRATRFRWHASGQMSHLILENPATGEQVTEWLFGTTLGTNGVARNDLVSGKIWPTGESESYQFNRQSDMIERTDLNGSVRAFTYDQLGKPLDDSATTVAAGVDGTLRRVSTAYNDRGLPDTITTYSDPDGGAGNVINQVKLDYDAFNQLIVDAQEHDGEVDGSTPEVGYGYTNGSGNVLRRVSITAPSGTQVDFSYGAAGSLDDIFNRVASLKVNGETGNLVDYDWCGLGRIATLVYPTPDAELSYLKPSGATGTGDAGDNLTGYDRFDRTIRMPWKNGTSGDPLADIAYGYDRASRRQWRQDLTPAAENAFDQFYRYDPLGQVKTADRGTLNGNRTAIGGIPPETEAWNYDEQGNWLDYDKAEDGSAVIEQARRSNQSNQIVAIDGSSAGVAYDENGNMTRIPTGDALTGAPRKLVWNAWDQLVEVRDLDTDALIQRNDYDGLFRRTTRTLADSTVIHQYYNDQWKPIEERKDASTDPLAVYYWGARPGHRDDLIRRDRDTDGNGTLDETLWCLMDYFDPIAILSSSGAVQERYAYSAFGLPLILAPDYSTRSSSSFAWDFLFHGQFTDVGTGYQNYGYRFFVPELGRWPSRDPAPRELEQNLYFFTGNSAANNVDWLGLWATGAIVNPVPVAQDPVGNPFQDPGRRGLTIISCQPRCECTCIEKRKWKLDCQATVIGKIILNSNPIKLPRNRRAGVYGHEQRHILSAWDRVQKWGETEIESLEETVYADKANCERQAQPIDAERKIRDYCDGLNNQPDHDYDPTTWAPEPGRPTYTPIDPPISF